MVEDHALLDPDRNMWHAIAVELRRQREGRAWSGTRLGKLCGVDRSTVSRWESGRLNLGLSYAKIIDAAWETKGLFARLVGFAASQPEQDWFISASDLDPRATRFKTWAVSWVPGLLQTRAYAAVICRAGEGIIDNPEEALERRMTRQKTVFERERPPLMSFLLDWTVLVRSVGGPEVMREQLQHLLEVAGLPYVSIRIVEASAGAHIGLDGPWTLITADGREVGFADDPLGARTFRDPLEVEKLSARFDRVGDLAAPLGASRVLIERALEHHR